MAWAKVPQGPIECIATAIIIVIDVAIAITIAIAIIIAIAIAVATAIAIDVVTAFAIAIAIAIATAISCYGSFNIPAITCTGAVHLATAKSSSSVRSSLSLP